ncbi:MAG TPA: Hpt domain-containing protein, partial [Gallionella sp.]|nr:Hpt domain-containing protein [Gallionella sp.]
MTGLDEGRTEQSRVCDDVDAELLPVFIEEADELCPKIGELLRVWPDAPDDERQARLLKRLLHTLKGSARMTGAMRIGELVHAMEDHVLAAEQSHSKFGGVLLDDFQRIAGL